jgi:hypothetical protein
MTMGIQKAEMMHKRFGRLLVYADAGKDHRGEYQYIVLCDCGESKVLRGSSMRKGSAKSCGCLRRETTAAKNHKHGGVGTPTYESWQGMKNRCLNANQKSYERYGAAGITIDPTWMDFAVFAADMGERPDGMTLDRIDNAKGYSKDNCRWATIAEQNRNTRQNVFLTHDGKTMCMKDWANETGIPYPTIQDRVRRGFPVERILTR